MTHKCCYLPFLLGCSFFWSKVWELWPKTKWDFLLYAFISITQKLCRCEALLWDMILKCASKACSPLFPSCFTRIWLSFSYSLMWGENVWCGLDWIKKTEYFHFSFFQYYEMSYGLNIEMHKQVCSPLIPVHTISESQRIRALCV